MMIATAIDVHHFILDVAIWKLRHHRIAGVPIRPSVEPASPGLIADATRG